MTGPELLGPVVIVDLSATSSFRTTQRADRLFRALPLHPLGGNLTIRSAVSVGLLSLLYPYTLLGAEEPPRVPTIEPRLPLMQELSAYQPLWRQDGSIRRPLAGSCQIAAQ